MTGTPFSYFDPLLLLPAQARRGLLLGPALEHDALAEGYGRFERLPCLAEPRPPADALVALEWQGPVTELLAGASERLGAEGVLLARLANRELPACFARRLYPMLDPAAGRGASLGEIRRALAGGPFKEHEVYAWLPSESFPHVVFPVQQRRMQRFYLEQLMPKWGLKGRIFGRLGGHLPPSLVAPYFLLLARKGG